MSPPASTRFLSALSRRNHASVRVNAGLIQASCAKVYAHITRKHRKMLARCRQTTVSCPQEFAEDMRFQAHEGGLVHRFDVSLFIGPMCPCRHGRADTGHPLYP